MEEDKQKTDSIKKERSIRKSGKIKDKRKKDKGMKEFFNVKERILRRWEKAYGELELIGLQPQSTKANILVRRRILIYGMLKLIEQIRKENLFYGKEKIKEVLLSKRYDLKLSTIENGLNILFKQRRIQYIF